MENWKDIQGYEDYQVSDLGNVKMTANSASRKERILKPLNHPKGYFRVGLYKNKKVKFFFIHRLVATHFIENPENKATINHINGDKSNNSIQNLEWNTYRENMNHSIENNLSSCGERNAKAKLNIEQVREIRNSNLLNSELCEKFKVSKSTIDNIKSNRTWKQK